MKGKRYVLEILWSTGDLTETKISEIEKELIEQYRELFILAKYELDGEPNARPISFQVWDENDEPLFPVTGKAQEVPA